MKLPAILLLATVVGLAQSAFSQTTPPDFQPDGILGKLVRTDEGPKRVVVGNDIYNSNGEGQSLRSAVSLKGRPAQYSYRLQNDGALADAFRVRGTKGNRFFRVAYLAGDRNVTGRITSRGIATGEIDPGESFSETIRVLVKPNGRAIKRSKSPRRAGNLTTSITAGSRGSASTDDPKIDRVLAKTFVTRR